MTKLYSIFYLCLKLLQLCTLEQLQAQAPDIIWAQQAFGESGTRNTHKNFVAHDSRGNMYVAGEFEGVITFDTTSLTSIGFNDIYIVKYDAAGKVDWAKRAGSAKQDLVFGIGTDDLGNIYITGSAFDTISFDDISISVTNCTNNTILAKYDAAGNAVWAKAILGTPGNAARGIAVDGSGNSYIFGVFFGTAVFGSTELTSAFTSELYIAKYDPAGNEVWVKSVGGSDFVNAKAIAVDTNGFVYVIGYYSGTIRFDEIALTASHIDGFIARYDASGNALWANNAGGPNYDNVIAVAADDRGNVYLSGEITGTATFGNTTLTGGTFTYIAKYNAAGNVLWAQKTVGPGLGMATDISGNVYLTGGFAGAVDFGDTALSSEGAYDIFVLKLAADGHVMWATKAGGPGSDSGGKISTDATGNVFVTGSFTGAATFGNNRITANGNNIFAAKYTTEGDVLWVKNSDGYRSYDIGTDIGTDGFGNTYVTGYFEGKITFGTTQLTSAGGMDVFIVKYDASGNVLWAKQAGGTNSDYGYGIAVDRTGNAYIIGRFQANAKFDHHTLESRGHDFFIAKYDASGNVQWVNRSASTFSLSLQSYGIALDQTGNPYILIGFYNTIWLKDKRYRADGGSGIVIAKYDAAGNVDWSQYAGGASSSNPRSIAVDDAGNSFITGSFFNSLNFGSITLTGTDKENVFIAKYNGSGNILWALKASSSDNSSANGIVTDRAGNSYVTGQFSGTMSHGTTTLVSSGEADIFIAKYDASGDEQWAQKAGGAGYDTGNSLSIDRWGNILVTGSVMGTASFNHTALTGTAQAAFIASYSEAGHFLWVQKTPGTSNGITTDETGNAYITGNFNCTVKLGSTTLTSYGNEMFVAKIGATGSPTAIAPSSTSTPLLLYPNPVQDRLQLSLPLIQKTNLEIRLLDANGKLLLKQNHTSLSGVFHHVLDLKDKAKGIYLLQLVTDREGITRRIVKE